MKELTPGQRYAELEKQEAIIEKNIGGFTTLMDELERMSLSERHLFFKENPDIFTSMKMLLEIISDGEESK